MKKVRKILKVLAIVLAVMVIAGLVTVDLRYGAIRSSPQVAHDVALSLHPSVRAVLIPPRAADLLKDFLDQHLSRKVPRFLIDRVLPYEVALIFYADHDTGNVPLNFFINEQRFGPLIEDLFNKMALIDRFPEIEWSPLGLRREGRGVLLLDGHVPMEPDARDAAWFAWTHPIISSPLPVEGRGFLEVALDNRDGGAYVAVMSVLRAYNFELDDEQKELALNNVHNVTRIQASADLLKGDALAVHLEIEVLPESWDLLTVQSIKVYIDDFLELWQARFQQRHGLVLNGQTAWEENVLVCDFRLVGLRKALDLLLKGKLF